jgi:hypothetical protein
MSDSDDWNPVAAAAPAKNKHYNKTNKKVTIVSSDEDEDFSDVCKQ